MSWRTVAIIMIVVFVIVGVQSILADPLVQTSSKFNATGDYGDVGGTDGNALITNLPQTWLDAGLVMIFGLLAYGLAQVVKRELTRGNI